MKKIYMVLFVAALFLTGCEKSEIFSYEQHAAVYFTQDNYNYSFLENPEAGSYTLKLPCDISGLMTDYDREIKVRVSPVDSLTTAEPFQYRIVGGMVKANEYAGSVEVELFRNELLDDSIYQVALEIVPNQDFPEIRLSQKTMLVSFTNKVIQPAGWSRLRWILGKSDAEWFSTQWWKFVCWATGRTSWPYWGGTGYSKNPDPETYWMEPGDVEPYKLIVQQALFKHNTNPDPDDPFEVPLRHDDGKYAGEIITFP